MLFKIFLFEIEFVVAKSEENVEYGLELLINIEICPGSGDKKLFSLEIRPTDK